MRTKWKLACAAVVSAGFLPAQMLVSAGWLAERLNEPSLVILHVGTKADYDAGHIPGARLLALADISITGDRGLRLELPPVEALEEAFGRVGVSESAQVVVYPGTESVQSATRVWFTLDYLGMGERASLLDGGLALWKAENRPLSTEVPQVEPRKFKAGPRQGLIVDAEWVATHGREEGLGLLDARLPEFYSGGNAGGMPRAGHIPGARNVPYTSLLDDQRRLRGKEALRELLGPHKRIVSYCHIGQQATLLYFAARYVGLEVQLYDGSFQDWSMRAELPVE